MSIQKEITSQILMARKNRDKITLSILTTILGEIAKIGKDNGNRETTDNEAISVLKKLNKSLKETINHCNQNNRALDDATKLEMEIINGFLPKATSENEILHEIDNFSNGNTLTMKDMGKVMGALKAKFGSALDGNLASKLVKKKING